jgi:DNA-binding LacI/PurR family transcriptional regulator
MNLEDVAQRAGVSTATVSRVLNNIGVVRSGTRARVLKAAGELKYHPNMHARALAGGASRTLGLIVSNLENPFFLDIFRVLEEEAHGKGYELLILNTDYDAERLGTGVGIMLGRRVAGLALIVSEVDPSLLDELESRKIRTVVYDVGSPGRNFLSIRTNYRKGMRRVAEYLGSLGHRRMAFVGHHTSLSPLSERQQAFIGVMEQFANVEFTTIADADGFAGGRQAARTLMSGFRPTAILCANDFMAVGVLRELRDQGIDVPRDVSVAGFDNISLSQVVYPALTTVHIPRDLIGRLIFENLTGATPASRELQEITIDPELVVRESTGAAPPL